MALSAGFQLSLELTQVFGAIREVASTARYMIDFVRQLRNSGSDIVVEEDLADVFGRMRVENSLEVDFKKSILAHTSITPLHSQSVIQLQAGPGPTVERALRDNDRRYLATVIQLSMLSWIHTRTQLASAISECLSKRMEMNLPGANPTPGYEGILSTLEACSSQTSDYAWNLHSEKVRKSLWQAYPRPEFPKLYNSRSLESLSANVLLSAMDCLCLVQSLPEDRIMSVATEAGMIPLIIWAHDILGLIVQVNFQGKQQQFGEGSPQVIIDPGEPRLESTSEDEVVLLDRNMEVIFTYSPEDSLSDNLGSSDRHQLCGYGTEILRRYFNKSLSIEDNAPLFADTAHSIVAFAILKSLALQHTITSDIELQNQFEARLKEQTANNADQQDVSDSHEPNGHSSNMTAFTAIERWRLTDAAKIVFSDIELNTAKIGTLVDSLLEMSAPEGVRLSDLQHPSSVELFLSQMNKINRKQSSADTSLIDLHQVMVDLVTLLLVLAHVQDIRDCSALPLRLNGLSLLDEDVDEFRTTVNTGKPIIVQSWCMFSMIGSLLLGRNYDKSTYADCFLFSDFGWSVHMTCCEDCDPAMTRPELIAVRRGVPTNAKTGERKKRMVDFPGSNVVPPQFTLVDSGETYTPRCALPVSARSEYLISRTNKFMLSVKYEIDISKTTAGPQKDLAGLDQFPRTSYRSLHKALYRAYMTNHRIHCPHTPRSLQRAALNADAVTVAGYNGWADKLAKYMPLLPMKVCIVLTSGDARARWLALDDARRGRSRDVMLRTPDTCANCALQAAMESTGKWILIL